MTQPAFNQSDLCPSIVAAPAEALDYLEFGVTGFDAETIVTHYNAFEWGRQAYRRNGYSASRCSRWSLPA